MTGEVWRQQLHAYLALRRALGFAMRPEARLLQDFVTYLERQGDRTSVAQIAVEWATATPGANHARRFTHRAWVSDDGPRGRSQHRRTRRGAGVRRHCGAPSARPPATSLVRLR